MPSCVTAPALAPSPQLGAPPRARHAPTDTQTEKIRAKKTRNSRRRAHKAFVKLNTSRFHETDRLIAIGIQGLMPRKRARTRSAAPAEAVKQPQLKPARPLVVKPALSKPTANTRLTGYSLQTLAHQIGVHIPGDGHAAPPHMEHPQQSIIVVNSTKRQTSKTDGILLDFNATCCITLEPTSSVKRQLQGSVSLAKMMVWAANSPPASTSKRSHRSGTCGVGVHWWNEAQTSRGVENIRLYNSLRFSVVRALWQHWVPVVAAVWAEVRASPQLCSIITSIQSDCDEITASGDIEPLHQTVPFTSGYMADAGERGTSCHFDQSTVGDTWVLIFSAMGSATSGGGFWLVDPVTHHAVSLGSAHGPKIVLCRAGLFEHGAARCFGGDRIVSVLWNSPRIRDDRRTDPRPLVVENVNKSWDPGGPLASYSRTQVKSGLQPKALFPEVLSDWFEAQPSQASAGLNY